MSTLNVSDELRFMTCGSVDDGKSTLIGHLLYRTGNVFDDQYKTLVDESKRIGNAGDHIDFSLLLDGLIAERDQGITIDVAYRYFSSKKRSFIVADTPGHEEYTRNMATAASNCNAAIILVDARLGVLTQTRRHSLICALCGIEQVCFAINKMDTIGWSEEKFINLKASCATIISDLNTVGSKLQWTAIPVSALLGDNLSEISANMPWYEGSTILAWLDGISPKADPIDEPFRFAVQYVIKPGLVQDRWQVSALKTFSPESSINYRGFAGRISSGKILNGDKIKVLPSGRTSRVIGIQGASGLLESAEAESSVSLVLADQIDVSSGDAFVHLGDAQECSDQFKVFLVWMQNEALVAGRSYTFKNIYGTALVQVTKIIDRIDTATFMPLAAERLEMNAIGNVEIALNKVIPFSPYAENKWCGSFLLIDRKTNATAASGMIQHSLRRGDNVHWQAFSITKEARAHLKQQKPLVLWFTGLSGSGKSTIADMLEKKLFYLGKHTIILDGDNVRHGLCKDLGFTEQDRAENIRRIGETAKLMTQAGLIVLACFVSPYRSDRDSVRALFQKDEFIEIFVDTPIEECESRDPKGLYKKARENKIPNFTGINDPYEVPYTPEVHLLTSNMTVEECVEESLAFMKTVGFR